MLGKGEWNSVAFFVLSNLLCGLLVDFLGAVFACGYGGVRVAVLKKMGHFLTLVVKIGVVTAKASQSEKLREWDGIFYVLWMRGRM